MNDINVTVIGNVATDVELRFTSAGDPVASFRVASNSRRWDRASERWADGDTQYFSVSCWRAMAHNVAQSVVKGMPIVVNGKLKTRELEKVCDSGDHTHRVRFVDVEAVSLGPDLARGVTTFTRVKREGVIESEERVLADVLGASAIEVGDSEETAA